MYTGCASTSLQAAALTTVGPTPTGVPASGGVPTPQTGGGAPVELLEDPEELPEDELLELLPVPIRPVVPEVLPVPIRPVVPEVLPVPTRPVELELLLEELLLEELLLEELLLDEPLLDELVPVVALEEVLLVPVVELAELVLVALVPFPFPVLVELCPEFPFPVDPPPYIPIASASCEGKSTP